MPLARLFHGEHVRLAPVKPEDVGTIARWYEDSEYTRLLDSSAAMPRRETDIRRYYDEQEKGRSNFNFTIRLRENDELIGILDLDDVQWNHGSAWLALGIGLPQYRGKGYGREAMELALQFAFDELNLHRVQLTVFEYNTDAIRAYERLGFVREGAFREALHRDGRRYDMLLYGLLRREWQARRAAADA